MSPGLTKALALLLSQTPLSRWPVRVRGGIAAGARWTLYPRTSYWRGTHEPAVQAAMLELGGGDIDGWSCWDLGAHFGLYSVGLARRVGRRGEVAAFEPNPASFARLAVHRRMNKLPWLKLYPAAGSDCSGTAELLTYGNLAGTTAHLPYEGETLTSQAKAIVVATLRLDDLVAAGELRLPQFVKIDVEGHGHRALAGMGHSLAAARPIVLAAFHSPQELDGMLQPLKAAGYRWRQVGAAGAETAVRVGGDYLFTPAD